MPLVESSFLKQPPQFQCVPHYEINQENKYFSLICVLLLVLRFPWSDSGASFQQQKAVSLDVLLIPSNHETGITEEQEFL